MIAQIVLDLPIDGPFDYLVPEPLASQVALGSRVKVSFGPRAQMGYVTGVIAQSSIAKLKHVQSVYGGGPAFSHLDLAFAKEFSAYYGCSLGEALGTMLRNKQAPSVRRDHKPLISLYRCLPDHYADKIQKIIDVYPKGSHFVILVPDAFRRETLLAQLKGVPAIQTGMRSSVFDCDGRYDCVIMVDEEDASYKQEQMPMYDAAQVLLMRSGTYGFDISFVGISPSVELMAQVDDKKITLVEDPSAAPVPARLVDLSNYKFIPGLISPPVRDGLEAALKAGQKSILVLNRRGAYRMTRCVDCAEILKCNRCDSSLIYSKAEGKFLCRHCTYTAPGETVCPKCHKPSWKSIGIGVEHVQTELKKYFPQANILSFERAAKENQSLGDFDILISTQAVLRFQGRWQVQMAAFIDFDAELNRLDMRSAFNAFSLALHISSMASHTVFIQTRNINHYVLQSLSRGKKQDFYDEELKLRKELGFSPFKHWIKLSWRGKVEKSAHEAALHVYNNLSQSSPGTYVITPPLADKVGRKRDQFRFNIMVQAHHVPDAVAFIKSALAHVKRRSGVIMTMNVDPT